MLSLSFTVSSGRNWNAINKFPVFSILKIGTSSSGWPNFSKISASFNYIPESSIKILPVKTCLGLNLLIPLIHVLLSPGFFWCKYHPGLHSSPSQNLSPYMSLLRQQEHFSPLSHDGLSKRNDAFCCSVAELQCVHWFSSRYQYFCLV